MAPVCCKASGDACHTVAILDAAHGSIQQPVHAYRTQTSNFSATLRYPLGGCRWRSFGSRATGFAAEWRPVFGPVAVVP